MDLSAPQIASDPVGHLPVIRGVLDQLGIMEAIDELSPRHPLAKISDGQCVGSMILSIMNGRVALFRMEQWLKNTDTELLFGEGCDPDFFNDTRLAIALDHLDEVGTDTIMGAIVGRYLAREDRPTSYCVHTDTTSFSLYGAYEGDTHGPVVAYGFSKAKRPDLKQLIFGLSLHGSVGIPLSCSISSGNTSDTQSNRFHLSKLSKLLPDSDEVTIVADCKLVDADTIGQVLRACQENISVMWCRWCPIPTSSVASSSIGPGPSGQSSRPGLSWPGVPDV